MASTVGSEHVGLVDVGRLVDLLTSPSPEVRIESFRALCALPLDSNAWLALRPYALSVLGNSDAEEQCDAIDWAWRIPLGSVRDQLWTLTQSGDPETSRRSVFALARAGDRRAVAPLLALLSSPATGAAKYLALVDVSIDTDQVEQTYAVLPEGVPTDWDRFWLAVALARSGHDELLLPAIERLTASEPYAGTDAGLLAELRQGPPLPEATLNRLRGSTTKNYDTFDAIGVLAGVLVQSASSPAAVAPEPPEGSRRQIAPLKVGQQQQIRAAIDADAALRAVVSDRSALPKAVDELIDRLALPADPAAVRSFVNAVLFGVVGPASEGAGNALVEMITALGPDYLPDPECLLDAYIGLGDGPDAGLRVQIAWAASRRGLRYLVRGLSDRLPQDAASVARLLIDAATYRRLPEPPRFFAGPTELPALPLPEGLVPESAGPDDKGAPWNDAFSLSFGQDGNDELIQGPSDQPNHRTPHVPRRLVARVYDGNDLLSSVLPPNRAVSLAIRVAIPERDDIAADQPAPPLPPGEEPTVTLEVEVRGEAIGAARRAEIVLSRRNPSQPSNWARFDLTTPADGGVVCVDILLLYRNKPLQAASFVSAVRDNALPGETPSLTIYELSGPDEPAEQLRPVGVLLDGRGADLVRCGGEEKVHIDTEHILALIEGRVSKTLGVPNAPDRLDHKDVVELLRDLARKGSELGRLLEPLGIGDERRINVIVNPDTPILPLELVYAGPPPSSTAALCDHIAPQSDVKTEPPPPGIPCLSVSTKRLCPYAFWGLYRSIARTVAHPSSGTSKPQPWNPAIELSSILYAATVKADVDATAPLPGDIVYEAALRLFHAVTRVTSWTQWRKAVSSKKPNLLVVLGHTEIDDGVINLFIGRRSMLSRLRISGAYLRADGRSHPLVLLIACATARGNPLGSLPGALTAKGAGAVVGTLAKIIGPAGASAATHLLRALHDQAGQHTSIGDAVAQARRSLIADGCPIGLLLVSLGEMDTQVEV